MAAFGLAIVIYLASFIFKFSFAIGFLIWFVLAVLIEIAEQHEKNEAQEKLSKEQDFLETRPCPMCAERIKQAAKKCRFCGEMLSQSDNF